MEIDLGSHTYFLTERGKFCADANATVVMNKDECETAAKTLGLPYTWSFDAQLDDDKAPFGCFLRHQKEHKHYGVNYRAYVDWKRNENKINASSICKQGNLLSSKLKKEFFKNND